jgi:Ser/Thr protein kinase RdoA (MazF antagonist)
MRLSTMWDVDRAVDGDGRSTIIDRIVARWPHDEGSAWFFRSSANFIAIYQRDGQRRFLRFADSSERDRDTIQAELDLVQWLATDGLAVSVPEPSLEGSLLETVEVSERTFHAVPFSGLSGEQFASDDLDHAGIRRWGEALGGAARRAEVLSLRHIRCPSLVA